MSETADLKFYLEMTRSRECICGLTKNKGKAFCFSCYKFLPYDLQRGLWKKLRNGYEEAYEQSVTYLKEGGKIE